MSLILNKSQAEAVYSAMCALNNVNFGRSIALSFNTTEDQRVTVREFVETHEVHIGMELQAVTFKTELHADQSAFATAYGLSAVVNPPEVCATPEEIDAARMQFSGDDHNINIDEGAAASHTDDGVWVAAWVYVSNEDVEVQK